MSVAKDKKIWEELDRLAFWASVFAITLLPVAYFVIADCNVRTSTFFAIFREFALAIISNLIPTFLLLTGSYALFRRIQNMRSDNYTEELADDIAEKVATKVLEVVSKKMGDNNSCFGDMPPLSEKEQFAASVSSEFELTDRYFDDVSNPQKLVFQFTNRSNNNILKMRKVKFSTTKDLPKSALLTKYRTENEGRYIIVPYNEENADILPGQNFMIEIGLEQKWQKSAINKLVGRLGYIKPEVIFDGQDVELFYSI